LRWRRVRGFAAVAAVAAVLAGAGAAAIHGTERTDDGQIVFVERSDGLTVTVSTHSSWGISDTPVPDLPSVRTLVELAASPEPTFPTPGES